MRAVPSLLLGLMAPLVLACGSSGEPDADSELPERADLLSAVDPFIATGGVGFGVGSAYPGPALPFAMIHAGPDTRAGEGGLGFYHCSGYYAEDPQIEGFSFTRMHGTGVPDYGTMALMPVDGMTDAKRDEGGYAAVFDKASEQAAPGYYSVVLDGGIQVEITSTLRAAIFRVSFPEGVEPTLLIDAAHVIGDATASEVAVEISGSRVAARMHNNGDLSRRFGGFEVYAELAFDPPPTSQGVWDDAGLRAGEASASGDDVGAWLGFDQRTVTARVGISFVDAEGARANLAAEIPEPSFDAVHAAATDSWREALSPLELYGPSERDTTVLATALYHAQLMPTLMSDVDGRAVAVDGSIVQSSTPRYSDFSLWDTYRTLHPWLLFSEHEQNQAFAESLVAMGREGGAVPRWALARGDVHSMIGSPGEIVLAESAVKGVSLDEGAVFELCRVAADGPAPGVTGGRGAIEAYLQYGYVPDDMSGGSVARTQEYAIADYALSEWAKRLGRSTEAEELAARARSYAALFDPEEGFFRGKNADGSWASWAGPLASEGPYTEGNAWQYLWLVPQDPEALAELLGGREAALDKLGQFFAESEVEEPLLGMSRYYWHGNEPDIHAPWLFAVWGAPAETARWVDWVFRERYGTGVDGLAGNDDGGTLSAWALFAATGLYPIAGTDRYIVGAPRYRRVVVRRPGGDLIIEADPDPASHPVPSRVSIDGSTVEGPYLTHAELSGEHTLRFEMASQ